MTLLIIFFIVAIGFSFYCSIAEAVLLSVNNPYISLLEQEKKKSGFLLQKLKADVNRPLAAILTLNTIAHTVGAAGVGAQATSIWGDASLGIVSAVLTLLILVLSEIIPKTLGATYWRALAPFVAYSVFWLVRILYPFVLLSEKLTSGMANTEEVASFTRDELAAIAEVGEKEGQLARQESRILKNLFLLRDTAVKSIMTPRSVVFSLSDQMSVEDYFNAHDHVRFSRIPVYRDHADDITGFVLRNDLLLAQARGNTETLLNTYNREMLTVWEGTNVLNAYEKLLGSRGQIMQVVDEYGVMLGIVTLEDILETLLGLEIVDEGDQIPDMQELARKLWRRRASEMGLNIDDL